jgi:BMFP domain-containing protein YqiC
MKFFLIDRIISSSTERRQTMLNRDAFNDIATKISEALPEPARKMQAQFKQQVEDLIAQGLKDLNVVTQEDYDKQTEKLSKAEAKLAELETRLAALEK